ncbi:MAG: hypothetical protein H6773_04555 [Pseudomonadales bacterium]|nr:hypothetical protein [Candidatus Woesebacteria bacterium]MCB9801428.1 hypothetical protein [Pseudomonadales bacterium]
MINKFTSKFRRFLYLLGFLVVATFVPTTVFAQDEDPIGTIMKPEAVKKFDTSGNIGEGDIGILYFASQLFTYITVLAGIWVFANLIFAGYSYITSSGNAQVHAKVRDRVTMSMIGMILIVTVYAVGALLGTIFFGNATYFINPTLEGPGTL